MQNIPVHLLNAFVVFNDSQNIVLAASKLGITQPALSKQLKTLESLIAQPLFTFTGRKKTLTPFGRDINERLKSRMNGLQELIQMAHNAYSNPANATLRISGRRGVLDRISEKINFQGSIFFVESTGDQVLDELVSLKSDLGISYKIPDSHEFIAKPLFKEEFKIAIPKKIFPHKKSYGETLLSELKIHPCIGYNKNDEILSRLFSLNPAEAGPLRMIRATSNYTSIAKMVEASLGWAVIPSYLEINMTKTWVVAIPSAAIPLREFFIIYRTEYSDVPWFRDLISEIKNCFKK
jgi:DNA-binding transcriptional LysR family regulator